MIKRLKWNVLYGDEDDARFSDSSEGSDKSVDSAKVGTTEAQKVLDALAKNDPNISTLSPPVDDTDDDDGIDLDNDTYNDALSALENTRVEKRGQSAGSEFNGESELFSEADAPGSFENDGKQSDAQWRECELCPGRRFLNDDDVQKHLESARHLKRAKKTEQQKQQTGSTSDANGEAQARKREKRKKETKKKLQALRRRKHEENRQKTSCSDITSNTVYNGEDNVNERDHLPEPQAGQDKKRLKTNQKTKVGPAK